MILGSHNTMSYLPVAKWWMKPFNIFSKCQDLDIVKQLDLGIRHFDIRIRSNDKGEWCFAHGLVEYSNEFSIKDLLYFLHTYKCSVRIIYEDTFTKHKNEVNSFILFVRGIAQKYKNLSFIEIRRKSNWKDLSQECGLVVNNWPYIQKVSSMDGNWFTKLLPRLYAKLNNKRNIKKYILNDESDAIMFSDFVDKY